MAVLVALAAPAGAAAHGASVPGFSEQQLRSAETALLGPEHAAEHARLRRYEREHPRATVPDVPVSTAAAAPLEQGGRWSSPFNIPVMAINAAMLPSGKVLWFSYPWSPDWGPSKPDHALATLWDPSTGTFKDIPPPIDPRTGKPVNLFCSGISFLADGRVLVTGGNLSYPGDNGNPAYAGLNHVYTFNPYTETWQREPDMHHGRWYPGQLLMPDGRTFIISGLDEFGQGVKNPELELFTPGAAGAQGTVQHIGGTRPAPGDYYPHLFWMPSGRGLVAGPYTIDSWLFNVVGDPPTLDWDLLPQSDRSRVWGTAVLVPGGPDGSHQVLQIGGSDKPLADQQHTDALAVKTETRFDERNPDNGWNQDAQELHVPRSHHNTVLLPDGSMVTVGGGRGSTAATQPNGTVGQYATTGAEKQVELWSPSTGAWTLGAAQAESRAYHSTAVLLPDGRVVSAGDDFSGPSFTQDTAEIYEPPYLFDGDALAPRPAITAVPSTMTWGEHYAIGTVPAGARDVTKAVLVAPVATTHAADYSQRYVPLNVESSTGGSLIVDAPPTANVAPTGRYMLFVIDETGTPSIARWVQVGPQPPVIPPLPPPSPPPTTEPPRPELKRPKVHARFVWRAHRRLVQLRVTKSNARTARLRLTLSNRRHRAIRHVTVTVKTGRTTVLRGVHVPDRARSVKASVRSLRM